MSGLIYFLNNDGQLMEMKETEYESEDILQELLAKYPSLLAGDQMDETNPRRWLFVTRELAVPFEESGSSQMWLDHLFLDQDAIPTLIEVKRSSDTRIRREVVGQMLDYAANAVVYLPIAKVQAKFEATCEKRSLNPDQVLSEFLCEDVEVEQFWQLVKTNLQAGKIRMLFVADEIAPALRRVVEFLNNQMDPAEVLAVEVKQFEGEGLKTLVPRLFGQTAEAQQRKSSGAVGGRQWDEPSFFEDLEKKQGEEEVKVAREILEWAQQKTTRVWYGHGKLNGSFVPVLNHKDRDHQLFVVWTNGYFEIYFYWYQYKAPFDDEKRRLELLERFNDIDGISFSKDAIHKRPSIHLSELEDRSRLKSVLDVFDWMIEVIKAS